MKEIRINIILLIFVLTCSPAFVAQTKSTVISSKPHPVRKADSKGQKLPVEYQTFQLDSKLMRRQMPYRIVFPASYFNKNNSARYSVIYLLHGLSGHYDNWTEKTKLAEFAANHNFIIVTPEGGDGWYTNSASVANDKYESYIIQELIPEIEKKFRTIPDCEHRAIVGLSMGGYGAIKFGLKYPDKFFLIGSFSGALDAPLRTQKNPNLRPSITSVFGPEDSKTRKDNDIFQILRDSTLDVVKRLPYIYMSCGTEDFLFQTNRDFDSLLIEKRIPHEYRELPGAHTWDFWNDQVQEFLTVAYRRLGSK